MLTTVSCVAAILCITSTISVTGGTTTDSSYVTTWNPDPMCPYPSDEDTYLPYPGNCTKYWRCRAGNKYEFSCPEGLWWHQEETKCDTPGDHCPAETTTETSTTTTTTEAPTTITTTTPSTTTEREVTTPDGNVDPRCVDENTSFWPHPSDCSKYIQCYKGSSYEMSCPEGLYFSADLQRCVNLDEAECCQTTGSCD